MLFNEPEKGFHSVDFHDDWRLAGSPLWVGAH